MFTYSGNHCLLNNYVVSGTIVNTWDIAANKTNRASSIEGPRVKGLMNFCVCFQKGKGSSVS